MKTRLATLFAAALAMAVAGTSSPQALAGPVHVPVPAAPASSTPDVTKVQAVGGEFRRGGRHFRGGRQFHGGRHFRGGRHYRGGRHFHGGRHHYRPRGYYRRHGGDIGPLVGGLIGGAIIGGIIANQPGPRYSYGDAHTDWCAQRYRSYDVRSDTFQPYNGPRRRCYSPYS